MSRQERAGHPQLNTVLVVFVIAVLSIWAVARVANATSHLVSQGGAYDLYPYWFASLIVAQGDNPYAAAIDESVPTTPIDHLIGGTTTAQDIALTEAGEPNLEGRITDNPPVLTPSGVMIYSPLASFSWPTAKAISAGLNAMLLVSIVLLTWSVMRWRGYQLSPRSRTVHALVFFGMHATSGVTLLQQPAIFVTATALAAVVFYDRGSQVLAGLALGIALSKPHLGLFVALFMAWRGQWFSIGVAALTQLGSLGWMALVTTTSPLDLISSYADLLRRAIDISRDLRVDLGSSANPVPSVTWLLVLACSIAILSTLLRCRRTEHLEAIPGHATGKRDLLALSTLAVGVLLTTRHLDYDMVINVLPLAVMISILERPASWRADLDRSGVRVGILATIVIHILPVTYLTKAFGAATQSTLRTIAQTTETVTLLAMLAFFLTVLSGTCRNSRSVSPTAVKPPVR